MSNLCLEYVYSDIGLLIGIMDWCYLILTDFINLIPNTQYYWFYGAFEDFLTSILAMLIGKVKAGSELNTACFLLFDLIYLLILNKTY